MAEATSGLDRYKAIFAAAPVGLVILNSRGAIAEVNSAFAGLLGRDPHTFAGSSLQDLVGEDGEQRLLLDPPPLRVEFPLVCHDGSQVETEWILSICEETSGRVFSVQDITLRKRQQVALRHSEERFRGMVRAVSDIVWTNNANGKMEGPQPSWGAFTGQSYEQYQGYGWAVAVHPDDAQPTIDKWNEAVANRTMFAFEHRVRRHDGMYRSFAVRAVPVFERDGSIREWVGVHTDITERRTTEEALRNSEGRLRLAQTAAGLGIWDLDFATGDLSWSRELHTLIGASDQELPSVELAQRFIHPDDRERVRLAVLRSLKNGQPLDITLRVVRAAGEVRWLLCRASVFPGPNGKPRRALGVSLDITFQKLAEHRTAFLLALEDVIRNLSGANEIVNSAAMLLAVHLDAGRCAYVETNGTLSRYQLVGSYTRDPGIDVDEEFRLTDLGPYVTDALIGGELVAIDDTESSPGARAALSQFRRMGIRSTLCAPLHKHGKPVALLAVHCREPRIWTQDERELVLAVASRCWESIERGKSESQLARSEERLQQVFSQAPVAIVVFRGRDLVVEMANPHYEALVQNRSMVGRPLREILPELGSHVFEAFDQVLDTGEPFIATDFPISYDQKADGVISDHWFNVVYHPLRDRDGTVSGVVAVCSEVTAQVVARRQLERANRELEEFAYVASHDLQEPLRMVGVYAQLLTRRYLSDDAKATEYAEFIRKGVTRMEQLIEDLLSFSRTIHAEESPGEADLNHALQLAMETMSTRIAETNAQIVVQAGSLPSVRGDSTQFALVFQNLLSNSLKYARTDVTPRVDIAVEPTPAGWTLSFRDNGIGFEQVYAERIFGLFKRLHKDAYAGTGLGLAICQRIVSRYGGSIRAEGRPGDGSTFFVLLPAAR
jgi:PAS domain S-box-containing protein